jgi:hypothetical protein
MTFVEENAKQQAATEAPEVAPDGASEESAAAAEAEEPGAAAEAEESAAEADAAAGKDPILEALWAKALTTWEDDKVHAALLEQALRAQRLPELAGRYRSLIDDAEKGQIAKKRIDGIVTAATTMLFSMKTPRPTKTPAWLLLSALATCLVMLAYLAYAILHR